MSDSVCLPIGYRFCPSMEEVIREYLLNKVTGAPLDWNAILEMDIYGGDMEPWNVFKDVDEDSMFWHTEGEGDHTDESKAVKKSKEIKKTIYVFTNLSKTGASSNAINKRRKAGGGTWVGKNGSKILDSNGQTIGSTRYFNYQHSSSVGRWVMREYALDGVLLDALRGLPLAKDPKTFVLCKISKFCAQRGRGEDGDEQDHHKKRRLCDGNGDQFFDAAANQNLNVVYDQFVGSNVSREWNNNNMGDLFYVDHLIPAYVAQDSNVVDQHNGDQSAGSGVTQEWNGNGVDDLFNVDHLIPAMAQNSNVVNDLYVGSDETDKYTMDDLFNAMDERT